jgi:hypothetical protein
VRTSLVFRECDTIEILWRTHGARFDHTGYAAVRASMDGGRGAACTVRRRAGFARPAVVRWRSDADRECPVSVLLALERVAQGERLSGSSARRPVRHSDYQGVVAVAVSAP